MKGIGTITIEVRSSSGIILTRRRQSLHSYVMNMLRMWGNVIAFDGSANPIKLTSGSTASATVAYFETDATDGRGIVVGSDNTPSTFLDFALGAKIAAGTGAGQLVVNTQAESYALNSGIVTAQLTRTFTNNSGGDVMVREVGVYASTSTTLTSITNQHLVLRDVISPVVVPNGGQIYIQIDYDFNSDADVILNGNGANWHLRAFETATNGPWTTRYSLTGTTATNQTGFRLTGAIGSTNGLRVGTSDTAYTKDASVQFALGSEIQHGSGSGQLLHAENVIDAVVETSEQGYVRVSRSFVNDSGAPITIKEIGGYQDNGQNAMMFRHVLPDPVTIPDGEGRTFFVDFKMVH